MKLYVKELTNKRMYMPAAIQAKCSGGISDSKQKGTHVREYMQRSAS
jgi:hypothetical protein